jgi:hypothetical protein
LQRADQIALLEKSLFILRVESRFDETDADEQSFCSICGDLCAWAVVRSSRKIRYCTECAALVLYPEYARTLSLLPLHSLLQQRLHRSALPSTLVLFTKEPLLRQVAVLLQGYAAIHPHSLCPQVDPIAQARLQERLLMEGLWSGRHAQLAAAVESGLTLPAHAQPAQCVAIAVQHDQSVPRGELRGWSPLMLERMLSAAGPGPGGPDSPVCQGGQGVESPHLNVESGPAVLGHVTQTSNDVPPTAVDGDLGTCSVYGR